MPDRYIRRLGRALCLDYQIGVALAHNKANASKLGIQLLPVPDLQIQRRHRRYASNGSPINKQFLIVKYLCEYDGSFELIARDSSGRQTYSNDEQRRSRAKRAKDLRHCLRLHIGQSQLIALGRKKGLQLRCYFGIARFTVEQDSDLTVWRRRRRRSIGRWSRGNRCSSRSASGERTQQDGGYDTGRSSELQDRGHRP